MTYAEELDALMAGTLTAAGFGHGNHVGVAFEALKKFDFFKSYEVLAEGLSGVASRAGVPEKFSATVTFAYLSAIAERMAKGTYATGEAFLAANPDLLGRDFLAGLYSPDRLASALARNLPLLPDLPSHRPKARV